MKLCSHRDREEGSLRMCGSWMKSYLITKARPVQFRRIITDDVTSILELGPLCADAPFPPRMMNEFPEPQAHATQMPIRNHRLRIMGLGAVLLGHYS